MKLRAITVMAALGLVALPALAGAAPQLTATGVRIGNHPAFSRVVVDFNGHLPEKQVEFERLTGTMALLHIAHPGLKSQVATRTAYGVRVALQSGGQQLHITPSFAAYRFKYVSYAVVTGSRLAIDLWKSAPPSKDAEIRVAPDACLNVGSWHVGNGRVTARGSEQNLFENTFRVVVRGANGRVLGQQTHHANGYWTAHVPYHATRRQAGTLEAVAFSPKDGSLACIAQVRVSLPAS